MTTPNRVADLKSLYRTWAGPGPVLTLVLLATLGLAACGHRQQPPPPSTPAPLSTYSSSAPGAEAGNTLYVIVPRLNLRACPATTNCQILSGLSRGEALTVLSQQPGWYQVRVQSTGREGWVGGRYVSYQAGGSPAVSKRTNASAPAASSAPPNEEWAEPAGEAPASPPAQAPTEAPLPPVQEEFAPVAPR